MKKETLKVKLTFITPILGSLPNNPEIMEEYIASKAPNSDTVAEEVAAITPPDEQFTKQMTVFPRDTDTKAVFFWDYQMRGLLKEGVSILIELGDIKDISKWAYKRAVDSTVFVTPRRIPILGPEGKPITGTLPVNQRPLRATTMQGDRICLAASEELPEGCSCEFTITLLTGTNSKSKVAALTVDNLKSVLEYGALKGFGQWRSGGYGRFTWEECKA